MGFLIQMDWPAAVILYLLLFLISWLPAISEALEIFGGLFEVVCGLIANAKDKEKRGSSRRWGEP